MPELFTKAKRSTVMASIRGQGSKNTELRIMALLRARYHRVEEAVEIADRGTRNTEREGAAPVFGKPDFVFRRERVAVFVDGCFWHGCPRHATMPAGNRAFWKAKLARNAARDREVTVALRKAGWRVVRVWECAPARTRSGRTMARIARALGFA